MYVLVLESDLQIEHLSKQKFCWWFHEQHIITCEIYLHMIGDVMSAVNVVIGVPEPQAHQPAEL